MAPSPLLARPCLPPSRRIYSPSHFCCFYMYPSIHQSCPNSFSPSFSLPLSTRNCFPLSPSVFLSIFSPLLSVGSLNHRNYTFSVEKTHIAIFQNIPTRKSLLISANRHVDVLSEANSERKSENGSNYSDITGTGFLGEPELSTAEISVYNNEEDDFFLDPNTDFGRNVSIRTKNRLTPLRLVDTGGHHVNPASRSRLDKKDSSIFVGETLYARLGRAVCDANCLPRKEFFEAWEVGRRIQKRFHRFFKEHDVTLVDLAAGHGFLAWVLLLSEPRIRTAFCVDKHKPASALRLEAALVSTWPHLIGRMRYVEGDMCHVAASPTTLLVSVHACGRLTDVVLELAVKANAPVAVVPCCHVLSRKEPESFSGWLEPRIAVDVQRAANLQAAGYEVYTQLIPSEITAENRLLMGIPSVTSKSKTGGKNISKYSNLLSGSFPSQESGDTDETREEGEMREMREKGEREERREEESSIGQPWSRRVLPLSPWQRFRDKGLSDLNGG